MSVSASVSVCVCVPVPKVFGKEEAEVPVHMVLWSCPSEDPRFQERENVTVEDRFPVGSRQVT